MRRRRKKGGWGGTDGVWWRSFYWEGGVVGGAGAWWWLQLAGGDNDQYSDFPSCFCLQEKEWRLTKEGNRKGVACLRRVEGWEGG